jgi:AcrR family transcriptional regulator
MAQRSKKDHIIATALPLFLEHGFKGTSIDMVVKACAVSKPTVYNHFPDKAALMLAVMKSWVERNKPLIQPIRDLDELDRFISEHWLTAQAVRLYAIVIGEGWRFPAARNLFWQQFDHLWRVAFGYVSEHSPNLERVDIEHRLDRRLLESLQSH